MSRTVALIANQGPIGGGEVMLLHIAEAVRQTGRIPVIVAPAAEPDTLMRARREGFETRGIPGPGRAAYMAGLSQWSRREGRSMRLWCNGLLPVVATAGLARRIAHLHQIPAPRLRMLASIGLRGADSILAPSEFVADSLVDADVFPNWTEDLRESANSGVPGAAVPRTRALRIGILGRLTEDKGIADLVPACEQVAADQPVELILGGETRFGSSREADRIERLLSRAAPPVRRLGWTTPRRFFSEVDIAAVPSNLGEAFGLVAAEAMSAGARLVVSDDGALPEVVGDDYPLIHRAGDIDDLANCLRQAAALTQSEATTLTARNRLRWEALYSPSVGTARVDALLSELEEVR